MRIGVLLNSTFWKYLTLSSANIFCNIYLKNNKQCNYSMKKIKHNNIYTWQKGMEVLFKWDFVRHINIFMIGNGCKWCSTFLLSVLPQRAWGQKAFKGASARSSVTCLFPSWGEFLQSHQTYRQVVKIDVVSGLFLGSQNISEEVGCMVTPLSLHW